MLLGEAIFAETGLVQIASSWIKSGTQGSIAAQSHSLVPDLCWG